MVFLKNTDSFINSKLKKVNKTAFLSLVAVVVVLVTFIFLYPKTKIFSIRSDNQANKQIKETLMAGKTDSRHNTKLKDVIIEQNEASIGQVLGDGETADSAWSKCDNDQDVITFKEPKPIIWLAKMDGCLMSCQGGSFTRIDQNVKYPRFAAYLPDGQFIPENYKDNSDLVLKITGKWIGVDYDHYRTVFDNKCVPVVDIEKIEVVE